MEQVDRIVDAKPAAASQFVERILTAVTTLRQQQQEVLDYTSRGRELRFFKELEA